MEMNKRRDQWGSTESYLNNYLNTLYPMLPQSEIDAITMDFLDAILSANTKYNMTKGEHPIDIGFARIAAERCATIYRQRAKVLLDALRRLLPLAEDGYKLHVSNACHQEFLSEDLEDIRFAKAIIDTYNKIT